MAIIIDRRKNDKNKSAQNRKKFIDRYRDQLKRQVKRIAKDGSIKDLGKKGKVKVKGTSEPTIIHDNNGDRWQVHPGNKKFNTGDKQAKPPSEKGGGDGGTGGDDGIDEFSFVLTKEEFLDIYFEGLELPDFIKESISNSDELTYKRAGYCKEGPYPKLDLKKTFERSLARRIAAKGSRDPNDDKKPRFLDDEDLRYRLFTQQRVPSRDAVMFCLMDVSGSMGQSNKDLAKQFYMLLYLFLEKKYEKVEIRFITYTQIAEETTEEEFFYGRRVGGTCVVSALEYLHNIMSTEYTSGPINMYVCHASDGDYTRQGGHEQRILDLTIEIVNLCQYYVYVQVVHSESYYRDRSDRGLFALYQYNIDSHKMICVELDKRENAYNLFRSIFGGKS